MNPISPFLERSGVVILDGALATELERRGADLRDPLWSAKLLIENPDLIRQVHHKYFAAGADVATTASYQATIPGLTRRGLSAAQAADLLRLSVRLAQQARDQFLASSVGQAARLPLVRAATGLSSAGETEASGPLALRPLVAASIGCYGAFLADGSEYRGDYGLTVQQLIDWHRPRVEILADSGADLFACETIPCLLEAEALVKLLGEFPRMPAWLSFSCKDERQLCHGESLRNAVELADATPNVIAVGVNCAAPRFIDGLLESVADVAKKPLVVYPNSGESWDAAQHCWQGTIAEPNWRECVKRWHNAGARLIGGCCRTTPETIRQIATALRPVA